MTEATTRRADEHNLRQAISEVLEQIYAIEYSMGLFYRKGNDRDVARASDDLHDMRVAVDRLGSIIAAVDHAPDPTSKVAETVG